MSPVLDWLPDEAFSGPTLTGLFSGPVNAWAAEWFAGATVVVAAVAGREPLPAQPGVQQFQHGCITLSLLGAGKRRVLEAVLGLDLAQQTLTEADRHILDVLATEIVEDLGKRLQTELGASDAPTTDRCSTLVLSMAGRELLAFRCPKHLLVPLLKKRSIPSVSKRGGLGSRMKALGGMPVVAEALLGHVELAVADIEGLAVGDVLVLDRSLTEPAELRLAGAERIFARGKVQRNNNRTAIQL